jgi:molybdopterin adenylyltransferase
MSTREHKSAAPRSVALGILSVSSTRSLADDQSGHWIRRRARKEGHTVVCHQMVDDDAAAISRKVVDIMGQIRPQAIVVTGGTGIAPRDVTIEALEPLFDKKLSAFGVLFAQLSYEQIDSAAILSRATAGVLQSTLVFCIPGSLKACQLACKALIFPELGHLAKHVREP